MHTQKTLVPPKRVQHKLPMKEGGEVNETCERFLSPDPDLLSRKEGWFWAPVEAMASTVHPFCMSTSGIFWKNFFATQISRKYLTRSQCHLLWTDAHRGFLFSEKKNVSTCQIMHYIGYFKFFLFIHSEPIRALE